MTEADAEIRPAEIGDKTADRGLLGLEPREGVLLPDVLRPPITIITSKGSRSGMASP